MVNFLFFIKNATKNEKTLIFQHFLVFSMETSIGIVEPPSLKQSTGLFQSLFVRPVLFDSSIWISPQKKKSLLGIFLLEASIGIEPMNQSFADSCLTAWLTRHILFLHFLNKMERETGLKPATSALARQRSINWAIPAFLWH